PGGETGRAVPGFHSVALARIRQPTVVRPVGKPHRAPGPILQDTADTGKAEKTTHRIQRVEQRADRVENSYLQARTSDRAHKRKAQWANWARDGTSRSKYNSSATSVTTTPSIHVADGASKHRRVRPESN